MTIEPSQVRFTFGTSVRTWADDKPPTRIIAKLFHDHGENSAGLTAAVQDVAAAVMRRVVRKEGHTGTRFDTRLFNDSAQRDEYSIKRHNRTVQMLRILTAGSTSRIEIAERLGVCDGQYFVTLFGDLCARGLITFTRARPRAFMTITDAGRAWLAEQEGAGCV